MEVYEGTVIIVGGAPRSGTTLTHALLCTSARANDYCPEVSFLQPIINAYRIGLMNWDVHTRTFYAGKDAFAASMASVVRQLLHDVWQAVGRPEVLCLKDPLLTPLFYWVHHLLGDQIRFVTVVRHPDDIIRSRQDVMASMKHILTPQGAYELAREINASYEHLGVPALQDAVLAVRYEDLVDPEVLDRLRAFTDLPDIDTERVWSKRVGKAAPRLDNPWHSPKYFGPISLGARLSPLTADLRDVVRQVCGDYMARHGYAPAGPALPSADGASDADATSQAVGTATAPGTAAAADNAPDAQVTNLPAASTALQNG